MSDAGLEAELEPEPETAAPAPDPFFEPQYSPEERRSRPQIVLGGDDDNPEWTRYLIPFLVLALLGGAGVAGLAALILH